MAQTSNALSPVEYTKERCREIKEAHDLIESGERSPCVTPSEASWILSDIRRMGGLTTRKELLDLVDPDRPPLIANPIPSDEHDGVVLHFGLLSEDMQRNRFAEDVMIVMVVDPITFEITLRPTRFLMHVNPLDFPPLLPIDWGFDIVGPTAPMPRGMGIKEAREFAAAAVKRALVRYSMRWLPPGVRTTRRNEAMISIASLLLTKLAEQRADDEPRGTTSVDA